MQEIFDRMPTPGRPNTEPYRVLERNPQCPTLGFWFWLALEADKRNLTTKRDQALAIVKDIVESRRESRS